jgi:chromosome segregation ATPase
MFKNRKKESAKKQRIRELTELVEKNTEDYSSELRVYQKHIEDNKLLLDNISDDYDKVIKANAHLRDQLLSKDNDIFELKKVTQEKLQEHFEDKQKLKFLIKEQVRLLDKERTKTNEYKRLYVKYHFMNTLFETKE